jgi:uncharacterized damage-inducible protein DinB
MKLTDLLLPEFDSEMASTRKTLERIPEDKFDWKPHEKSTPLGALAGHLAELAHWCVVAIRQDVFDAQPPGGPSYQPWIPKSRQEVLDKFDKDVREARAAIAESSDETLTKNWSLLFGGKTLFTRPRINVIRDFVLSHGIHHRAQLGVYLRLNDIPVPSIYGPSADEGQFGG